MKPEDVLKNHPLTHEMRRRGVKDDQLSGFSLSLNEQAHFREWKYLVPNGVPDNVLEIAKAYCALRWLVVETPPESVARMEAMKEIMRISSKFPAPDEPPNGASEGLADGRLVAINKRNKEVWDARTKRTDELLSHLPTAKMAFAEYQLHAEDESFEGQKPYDFCVDRAERMITKHPDALVSAVNSFNASASRPKKKPTHRTIVVDVMRIAIREGATFPDFLANFAEERDGGLS